MKQRISRLIIAFALVLGVSAPVLAINTVTYADAKSSVCDGIAATGATTCDSTGSASAESAVQAIVKNIINIFSWVAGVVSVIMVMLGGFWYITSNGDAAKATRGRTTITYALVGLVIVALSQVMVRFVIGSLFKL